MCECLEPVPHSTCGQFAEFVGSTAYFDWYRCPACNVDFGRRCELASLPDPKFWPVKEVV